MLSLGLSTNSRRHAPGDFPEKRGMPCACLDKQIDRTHSEGSFQGVDRVGGNRQWQYADYLTPRLVTQRTTVLREGSNSHLHSGELIGMDQTECLRRYRPRVAGRVSPG